MTAPIVLFTFSRPHHTERVLEALRANSTAQRSPLIIYSDAPRHESHVPGVNAVRNLLRRVDGFASISLRERQENFGLSQSLISGIGEVLKEHDRLVVLEDDLVVSPWFLDYVNEGLSEYAHDESVASIHGYTYPVLSPLPETFFIRGADCWGWGTWRRAWRNFDSNGGRLLAELKQRRLSRLFDFDGSFPYSRALRAQSRGRLDSWAIRWYASAFLRDMYTLYPGKSLVDNIGHDGSGENCDANSDFQVSLSSRPVQLHRQAVVESPEGREAFTEYFRAHKEPTQARIARRARSLLGHVAKRA